MAKQANWKFLRSLGLALGLCLNPILPGCGNVLGDGDQISGGGESELRPGDCNDQNGHVEQCDADQVCRAGRCIPRNGGCLNNAECAADQVCDAATNLCVDLACPDRDICTLGEGRNHRCVLVPQAGCCLDDSGCAGGEFCAGNVCEDVPCEDDPSDCVNNVVRNHECAADPIPGCCLANEDCGGETPLCDMDTNRCVGCLEHTDCAADQMCTDGSCVDVECEANNECDTATVNPDSRQCTHHRAAAPGCCLNNADCGDGFCPVAGEACVECRNNADCDGAETCNNGTCAPVACGRVNLCDVPAVQNHVCTHSRRAGCCLDDSGCGAGVCEDNRCVECRVDNDCGNGEVCDVDNNNCVAAQCPAQAGCTEFVFNNNTRQCDARAVPNCCSGQDDNGPCRQVCANNADCVAGFECRAHAGEFYCVPSNLPLGYALGCETDAVAAAANHCTSCRELDESGNCARFDLCANGLDDNGDGRIDEGVLNNAANEPNPAINCVQCNVDSDCRAGLECNLLNGRCIAPVECVVDVDCRAGLECINNVCAEPPMVDVDGDGLEDDIDNCPQDANANQSDVDRDGVGDVCDNCPAIANANQSDADHNGVGDVCEPPPAPECSIDGDCNVGEQCVNNACEPIEGFCRVDSDCNAGFICTNNRCVVQEQQGAPTCGARFLDAVCGAGCYGAGGRIVCLWTPEDLGRQAPVGCSADQDGDRLSPAQGDCNDADPAIAWCWGGVAPSLCRDLGIQIVPASDDVQP